MQNHRLYARHLKQRMHRMWKKLFARGAQFVDLDIALLVIRVLTGIMLCFGHGIQKYSLLITNPEKFPDPLGIGHVPSILSSMGAECIASMMVAVGLLTRLACLPIICTMTIVALVVHHGDTWQNTEPSVLYGLLFVFIAILGPGRYALDNWLLKLTKNI